MREPSRDTPSVHSSLNGLTGSGVMKLRLQTTEIALDGCFGELRNGDDLVCLTLERTFDDGKPVIPAGVYRCQRTVFARGGYPTFEITGVEGHSRLLFHKGNVETDSIGCVLLGTSPGLLPTKDGHVVPYGTTGAALVRGLQQSKLAFDKFWALVCGEDWFDLDVTGR